MRRILIALALVLAACGSDAESICEKLDECNILRGISVDECTERLEDRIEDENLDEGEVDECADCFARNSCSELLDGDCADVCDIE